MNSVFITDDPQNLVFIVTMMILQHTDSGSYWCCVDDGCRRSEDSSGKLELLVSTANVPQRKSKVVTFKKLTGETGGSVTIPCFYGQDHKNAVKSWCKGESLGSCSTVTRSDSLSAMNSVFIIDDPQNLVFIVTMRNLLQSDSGYYYCAVGGDQGRSEDSFDRLNFTVRTEVKDVRTVSWVSAERGGSVTIPCYYHEHHVNEVKSWCRGDVCSSILAQSDREQSGGNVAITDDHNQRVFYVTMRNLQEEDSGYYSCCVGDNKKASLSLIVREGQNSTNSSESNTRLPLSVGILGLLLLLILLLLALVTILCRRSTMAQARDRNRENTVALTPTVDPGDEVTYISVTAKPRNTARLSTWVMPLDNMAAADPDEVVYSTVARK